MSEEAKKRMKKGFILTLLMGLVLSFASCTGCNKGDNTVKDSVVVDSAVVLDFEHTIATDREAMYLKGGENNEVIRGMNNNAYI